MQESHLALYLSPLAARPFEAILVDRRGPPSSSNGGMSNPRSDQISIKRSGPGVKGAKDLLTLQKTERGRGLGGGLVGRYWLAQSASLSVSIQAGWAEMTDLTRLDSPGTFEPNRAFWSGIRTG